MVDVTVFFDLTARNRMGTMQSLEFGKMFLNYGASITRAIYV